MGLQPTEPQPREPQPREPWPRKLQPKDISLLESLAIVFYEALFSDIQNCRRPGIAGERLSAGRLLVRVVMQVSDHRLELLEAALRPLELMRD